LKSNVVVDASPVGLGLVHLQFDPKNPSETMRVVKYESTTLSEVERRYSQVEWEALAVV